MNFYWATVLLCAVVPASAPPQDRAPVRTLRYIVLAAEAGFEPAVTRDLYSGQLAQAIFETLYPYDYLARPALLVPGTAQALLEVSADGKT